MRFISKWKWELFLPIAGVLLTLAFAPFEFSYLAIFSLAIVFLSWLDSSPARAATRGYLYGLGLYGSGIPWVYISIHDYGGAPELGAFLLTLLVICFWALFPALTGYLSVKLAGRKGKNYLIWLMPFVWIFIEYFRGYWLLNGFPWLQIAYSQMDTPLQGFIPIMGVYGTGFLLAFSASVIIAGFKQTFKPLYAILVIASLWATGAYLQTVEWTHPIGKEINVALIQGGIPQDQKWLPQNRIQTLLSYKQMTENNWDADVIVWPETAIPVYLSQVKESYLSPLSAQAKLHNTNVILGILSQDDQNNFFNSVVTLGQHEGQYNKAHLLPFGEYLPLQPLSGFVLKSLNIQLGNFASGGNKQALLIAGGHPFATSICYEDAFGDEVARSLPQANFLVNVTNDAWFGHSIEPYQHMQIAQMRSLETGRYMLRSTNTGVTAIVAPDGKIVKEAPLFKQTVLKGQITPMGGMTPYARIGDTIILLILAFCFLAITVKPTLFFAKQK